MRSRKAGDALNNNSETAKEATGSIQRAYSAGTGGGGSRPFNTSTSGDSSQYQTGGKYNSGRRVGEQRSDAGPTTASDRTLSGYYAPDNSTEANINRSRAYINSNRDAQEEYKDTSHIAQGAIDRAKKNAYINPAELDNRVQAREQYNRAQGTVQWAETFGDSWAQDAPNWNSADPARKLEPIDFEKMYDKYKPD